MFTLAESELDEYHVLTEAMFDTLDGFDAAPAAHVENVSARRDAGRQATRAEDPFNAVIRWCEVTPEAEGALSGKRIALKDNMALAGVPMTFGSRVIEGYVPETDCVVAERVLRAGGQIVAKTNLENFAWSGGGETSRFGPVLNPHDSTRTASGSSGGSAAALFYENVDIAFGTDQGGSIRLPAAWCGVLGHKPTFGLVPYTGIGSIDPTYDHVGPIARTVGDLALALDVVAGSHPTDPRQRNVPVLAFRDAVSTAKDDFSGVRVGVLEEGFGWSSMPGAPEGTGETEAATREVLANLERAGAELRPVSVPGHLTGAAMMFAALAEGQAQMLHGFGNGYHSAGRYAPDLSVALGRGLRSNGDELPPTVKLVTLLGAYLHDTYFGSLYGKAQNLAPLLREAYDSVLSEVDCLVMPTATHYAHKVKPDASTSERVLRGWGMVGNTAPFDATGHPALSIPAASANGLPVGVMIVGRYFADADILGWARTYEGLYGWQPDPPAADRV